MLGSSLLLLSELHDLLTPTVDGFFAIRTQS